LRRTPVARRERIYYLDPLQARGAARRLVAISRVGRKSTVLRRVIKGQPLS